MKFEKYGTQPNMAVMRIFLGQHACDNTQSHWFSMQYPDQSGVLKGF